MSELFLSPRITPMAPLQVDPYDYLKPHHPAGRCPSGAAWAFSL